MELQATRRDGVLTLRPQGRINHTNAEAFHTAMAPHLAACAEQGDALLFDLSQLEYVSSAALRIFMLTSKQVTAAGGRMAMAAAQPVMLEILEISRFNLIFRIHPTVADAIAALTVGV